MHTLPENGRVSNQEKFLPFFQNGVCAPLGAKGIMRLREVLNTHGS